MREEQNNIQVVGEEVRGSEGPHYQGVSTRRSVWDDPDHRGSKWVLMTDQQPGGHPLTDLTGGWTMMNPIYTEAVSIIERIRRS
jgi:hypothetical protein